MDNFRLDKVDLSRLSANYFRDYAYENGDQIYQFMKAYDIGESAYGRVMDYAAEGKNVMAHRLYGHSPYYDFPHSDLSKSADFLEHLFSDMFTKQGLPIIPGEILEDHGLLKACDKLTNNWNFINGFDILAGTVAIYAATKHWSKSFSEELSIDTFDQFAKHFGIGSLELAISISTANPFLLIGSVIHLTASIRASITNGSVFYFKKFNQNLHIAFKMNLIDLNKLNESLNVRNSNTPLGVKSKNKDILL